METSAECFPTQKKSPAMVEAIQRAMTGSEKRNSVCLISGNKGGVGKSATAILLADYVQRKLGRDKLVIGDAEASDIQRTFANLMLRSGAVSENQARVWSLDGDEQVEAMLDEIFGMNGKTVIIDTGANMLGLLTRQAEFIADAANDINSDITVIFVAGPGEESTDALKEYLAVVMKLPKASFRSHVLLMGPEEIGKRSTT